MAHRVPLLFVLLWSTGFVGAKYALPYIEPFNLLFIRMLITLAVFLVLVAAFRPRRPGGVQAIHQMVVGSLVHAAYLGGVFVAIDRGMPAGIIALLVSLQPLLTALLVALGGGTRLHGRQWGGLLLGLAGVSMVLLRDPALTQFELHGDTLLPAAVALFGISLGTLYQKRHGPGVDLLAGSFYQYLATALIMGCLSWAYESGDVEWSLPLVLALGWLVMVLSVGAILLLMWMIREGEAARVATYFYLVPPVTALQTWLLFDEKLGVLAILGVAVTVIGVYLVIKRPRSPSGAVSRP
jgi:drug/metabolite transporter (DMT)-like permease